MNKLVSFLILSMASASAFAERIITVPEPETLALFAIGVVGMLVARSKK